MLVHFCSFCILCECCNYTTASSCNFWFRYSEILSNKNANISEILCNFVAYNGLESFYLDGCNFLTAAVSPPAQIYIYIYTDL
jgi:hypothetical protein